MFKHIYELAKEHHCKISISFGSTGTLVISADGESILHAANVRTFPNPIFKIDVFQHMRELAMKNDCSICVSINPSGFVYISVYRIALKIIELYNDWDNETIITNIEDIIKKANEEMEEEEC